MADIEEPMRHQSSGWCGYEFEEHEDLEHFRAHLWKMDLSGDYSEKLREVGDRHHWDDWQWREFHHYRTSRAPSYWEPLQPTPEYVYDWSSQGLRFEDGDVLVKLSADPEEWLLLHSQVLASVSPVMHSAFKDEWSRSTISIIHPVTKRGKTVFLLCLQYDSTIGALFLQPGVEQNPPFTVSASNGPRRQTCLEILCRTKYALVSPLESDPNYDCRCESNRARSVAHFKIFITFLYGLPFDIEEILHCGFEPDFDALYDVIAWANFYLCLPSIADTLKGAIDHSQSPWRLLADGSINTVQELSKIAQALRFDELLMECIRHQLTLPSSSPDAHISPHIRLHLEKDELDALLGADGGLGWDWKPEAVVDKVRRRLEEGLLPQVGFHTAKDDEDGYWHYERATFRLTHHSALKTEVHEMPKSPMEMQASILAGGIFREWCNLHTTGDYVAKRGESMASHDCYEEGHCIEGSLVSMCLQLQSAKKFSNPSSLISETVAADYACLFSNGGIIEKVALAKAIRSALDDLILNAAWTVYVVLSGPTVDEEDSSEVRHFSSERKYRGNSIQPRHRETFTYFPLFEKNVPWWNKPAWTVPEGLKYDSTPASPSWLQLLDIGQG